MGNQQPILSNQEAGSTTKGNSILGVIMNIDTINGAIYNTRADYITEEYRKIASLIAPTISGER